LVDIIVVAVEFVGAAVASAVDATVTAATINDSAVSAVLLLTRL
jgi:hypothetical protein